MRQILATAFALFLLSGCVTTNVTRLNNETYESTNPEDVTIYLQEEDIPTAFAKIAVIHASGTSGWTNEEQMYNKVREDAAELGADGVLIESVEEAGTGEQIASAFFGTHSDTDGKMIAIKLLGEEPEELEGEIVAPGGETVTPSDSLFFRFQ